MRNDKYWAERSIYLEEMLHGIGEEHYKGIASQFDRATKDLQKEIEVFYARFAKENEIPYTEAMGILTGKEKEAYIMTLDDYIQKAKQYPFTDEYQKELKNASAAYRVTRLQNLQLQMRNRTDELMSNCDRSIRDMAGEILKTGYYHQIYELQKGLGIGTAFDRLSQGRIDLIVSKPWLPDGKDFSTRVWGDQRGKLTNFLEKDLTNAIIRGSSLDTVVSALHKQTGVLKRNVYRLIETEASYFTSKATGEAYQAQKHIMERYKVVATLDEITSDICRDMDHKDFAVEDYEIGVNAPPFHPFCRSTTAPYFERDDIDEMFDGPVRAARNPKEKTYYVPADMTYKAWYAKYVEPAVVTGYDLEVVKRYFGGESYVLNEKLREGTKLSTEEQDWANRLDIALKKMPVYNGVVNRSMSFINTTALRSFVESLRSNEVRFPAYTSTSKGIYDPDDQVRLIIKSKTAADLEEYNPGEQEVLFKRDSKFRVMSMEKKEGKIVVNAEEVTDG